MMTKVFRFLIAVGLCLLGWPIFAGQTSIIKTKTPPKPRKQYAPAKLPHKIEAHRGGMPARDWTILYYMDADNNLEPFMMDDVDEMEMIGSTDNVNAVAMLDRTPQYETRDGDWANTKIL